MQLWKKRKRGAVLDRLIKVRGGTNLASGPTVAPTEATPYTPRRNWQPRALRRTMTSYGSRPFYYSGSNQGDFYRWMRDNIPILSSGIWAWVRLCATKMTQTVEGNSEERQQAVKLLNDLDRRILEMPYGRGSGLVKLTEGYFLELFTTGRFAGEAVLSADGKSVDHFRYIDPFTVSWEHSKRGWIPYVTDEDDNKEKFDPDLFFYGVIGSDLSNPSGVEPLACIPFVTEVEQMMLEDMARSSHNSGTPRLQVKVSRPTQFDWEEDNGYASRANQYFNDVVKEFQFLEPDDNIFTWSDVEVTVVGQTGHQAAWRLNREQVIEDVITGLRLYPWVLGRSHKNARNWMRSQYDLLMQIVASHQKSGADLVNWISNLELQLRGVKASVKHSFDSHPDPFRLDRAKTHSIELQNIDMKVKNGYISKDEGAREMGYQRATG